MEETCSWSTQVPPRIYAGEIIMQIGVLLGFTLIDGDLKNLNVDIIVPAVVCFYIHLVSVFFAFRIGEDCDTISAFLAAPFSLLYNLSPKDAKSIIGLGVVAVVPMWTRNLLLLNGDMAVREQMEEIFPPKSIMSKIQRFDKALRTIKTYLNNCPRIILWIAGDSIVVTFTCAVVLEPVLRSMPWIILPIVIYFALKAYLIGLHHRVNTKWRKHIRILGVWASNFPFAFTLVKSNIQIVVLLGFNLLDRHLKKRNGFLLVAALVSFHIHLVTVFFAFRIAEDYDIINAFLAAPVSLIHDLYPKSIIGLAVAAIFLMWTRNLMLLPVHYLIPIENQLDHLMHMQNTTEISIRRLGDILRSETEKEQRSGLDKQLLQCKEAIAVLSQQMEAAKRA